MNDSERELWKELRRKEHEKRGAILRDTRERLDGLAVRVISDEPKCSPAVNAVSKASDSLGACRWPLEDIAAHDFDDKFAIKAFDARKPEHSETEEREPAADEWMNRGCWWTPTQAARVCVVSREKLSDAARAGKIGVRAAKHGLLYQAGDVVKLADGH